MDTWKRMLARSGRRVTQPRIAVIDAMRGCDRPQSPEQVLENARKTHPDLGLATVYRTLALFAEIGIVRLVHYEGTIRYAAATLGHRHALVCTRCGKLVEFPGRENIGEVIEQVERETGFVVKEHLLQLSGICPECQMSEAADGQ